MLGKMLSSVKQSQTYTTAKAAKGRYDSKQTNMSQEQERLSYDEFTSGIDSIDNQEQQPVESPQNSSAQQHPDKTWSKLID